MKTHDVNLTLSGVGSLSKSGHVFIGWNTAADGTGIDYAADRLYSNNASLDLFAKWDRIPTVLALTPAHTAIRVSPDSDLVITFSENIVFGTGAITLRESGGTVIESFDVASPPTGLTLSGATVTLDPSSNLLAGTGYFVEIDATAIDDLTGNSFAGSGTSSFSTAEQPPPTVLANSYLASLDVFAEETLYSSLNFPSYLDGSLIGSSTLTTKGFFGSLLVFANNGAGNAFNGNLVVDSGTLRLGPTPFATSTGGFTAPAMTSSNTLTLRRAGILFIDDNSATAFTANRFGSAGQRPSVNLAGGRLDLNGLNNASSSVQTFGPLTAGSGLSTVNVTRHGGSPVLQFESFTRNSGSVVSFNDNDANTLGTNDTSAPRVLFTTAPNAFTAGLTAIDLSGNALTFTHPEADARPVDVTVSYEWSLDLTTWHDSGDTVSDRTLTISAVRNTPQPGTTTVTAALTGAEAARIFVRAVTIRN